MSDEQRRRRNLAIAALVGGFLLPLAGLIGAALFYAQDEREIAWRVLVASALGAVVWILLFTA